MNYPKDRKDPPMVSGEWTCMTQGCLGPQNDATFEGPMILRVIVFQDIAFGIAFGSSPYRWTHGLGEPNFTTIWSAENIKTPSATLLLVSHIYIYT